MNQAVVQQGGMRSGVAIRTRLAASAAGICRTARWQKIVLEGAVIAAAGHPDVGAAQPIPDHGQNRGLIETALG